MWLFSYFLVFVVGVFQFSHSDFHVNKIEINPKCIVYVTSHDYGAFSTYSFMNVEIARMNKYGVFQKELFATFKDARSVNLSRVINSNSVSLNVKYFNLREETQIIKVDKFFDRCDI
jgi:uncharacterized protein YqgQ